MEAVAGANPNTVVLLLRGSVMELPRVDLVTTIRYMGLLGQVCSQALSDLLTGKGNLSGKMKENWPHSYANVIL